MQIEPGLSWEGSDSICIYWFNQLRVPYIVWSPTGIHLVSSWDSAHAAKAKNREEKGWKIYDMEETFFNNTKNGTKDWDHNDWSPFQDDARWYTSFDIQSANF